jgi:hypothetical protein
MNKEFKKIKKKAERLVFLNLHWEEQLIELIDELEKKCFRKQDYLDNKTYPKE